MTAEEAQADPGHMHVPGEDDEEGVSTKGKKDKDCVIM